MEALGVERLYALSLYEAAEDLAQISQVQTALEELRDILWENVEFLQIIGAPSIDKAKRKEIAEQTLSALLPALLMNFILVLIDKGRIGAFFGIAKAFESLAQERSGQCYGEAVSVVALTDEQLVRLEQQTGKLIAKDVKLANRVDSSLIAGVIIYIDGRVIDASVRTGLDRMRESILR